MTPVFGVEAADKRERATRLSEVGTMSPGIRRIVFAGAACKPNVAGASKRIVWRSGACFRPIGRSSLAGVIGVVAKRAFLLARCRPRSVPTLSELAGDGVPGGGTRFH